MRLRSTASLFTRSFVLLIVTSCSSTHDDAALDCTHASPADVAGAEVTAAIEDARGSDGSIHWDAAEPRLTKLIHKYGGCPVGQAVSEYAFPRSPALTAAAGPEQDALAQLRDQNAAGARAAMEHIRKASLGGRQLLTQRGSL